MLFISSLSLLVNVKLGHAFWMKYSRNLNLIPYVTGGQLGRQEIVLKSKGYLPSDQKTKLQDHSLLLVR